MQNSYDIKISTSTATGLNGFAQRLREVLVRTGLHFLLYVILGLTVCGGVGVWAATQLMMAEASLPEIVRVLGAMVIVIAYLALGLLAALLLALLTTVMKGMMTMKEIFHALVAPVTAGIIEMKGST